MRVRAHVRGLRANILRTSTTSCGPGARGKNHAQTQAALTPEVIVEEVRVVREHGRQLVQAHQDHQRRGVLARRERHHVGASGRDGAAVG